MMPTKAGKEAYEELESKFLTLNFEEIFQKMEPVYAEIELPRMKMEFQSNLKKVLEDIGIYNNL
jgi:serine protease inhibitor